MMETVGVVAALIVALIGVLIMAFGAFVFLGMGVAIMLFSGKKEISEDEL